MIGGKKDQSNLVIQLQPTNNREDIPKFKCTEDMMN